jgi:Zn-dependent peptidase ImmA (M78 family)
MKFDPKKLRYSRHGTPILSVREIEAVADEILETHCADVLKKPGITPVVAIIDRLRERTGLLFAMEDLGYKGTAKILGKVSFHRKALYLDLSLNDERKAAFRFTAAHEVGHWVLHRYNYKNWKFNDDQPKVDGLEDDEGTLCRLEQRTPKDWLEFQANVFAASLIMPREMFVVALIAQQQTMGITKNHGLIYLSAEEYARRDFQTIVMHLSHVFGVSKESVHVRVRTLKLLEDETATRTKHIGRMISTK